MYLSFGSKLELYFSLYNCDGGMLMYHFAASGLDECRAPPECRWMSAALCGTTSQLSWVQPQTHLWTAGRKWGKDVIKKTCCETTGSSQKRLAFKVLKGSTVCSCERANANRSTAISKPQTGDSKQVFHLLTFSVWYLSSESIFSTSNTRPHWRISCKT